MPNMVIGPFDFSGGGRSQSESEFDPSWEEMEAFKRRAGVRSDLPEMGRSDVTGGCSLSSGGSKPSLGGESGARQAALCREVDGRGRHAGPI